MTNPDETPRRAAPDFSRALVVLSMLVVSGLLVLNAGSRPAHADEPQAAVVAQPVTVGAPAPLSEGVDWSRVAAAPVSTGATVGAYD